MRTHGHSYTHHLPDCLCTMCTTGDALVKYARQTILLPRRPFHPARPGASRPLFFSSGPSLTPFHPRAHVFAPRRCAPPGLPGGSRYTDTPAPVLPYVVVRVEHDRERSTLVSRPSPMPTLIKLARFPSARPLARDRSTARGVKEVQVRFENRCRRRG